MNIGETKRRIHAARILRDKTQDALDKLVAEEWGFDVTELSRTERGVLPLTRPRQLAYEHFLNLPPNWFTEESVDRLLGVDPRSAQEVFDDRFADHRTGQEDRALGDVTPSSALDAMEPETDGLGGHQMRDDDESGEDGPGHRERGR